MGSFEDFIRYGFPGYVLISSILVATWLAGLIPTTAIDNGSLATVVGAAILIVGPLFGFLVHQVYFLYFDTFESYEKVSRPCIKILAQIFRDKISESKITETEIQRQAFMAWKLLTTNFEKELKLDALYITRLRSLRNFSHSFGAIATSSIISILVSFLIAVTHQSTHIGYAYILLGNVFLAVLFLYKRTDVSSRINEMETAIVLRDKDLFGAYMLTLHERERENEPLIRASGLK